jgi:hypothetical protein
MAFEGHMSFVTLNCKELAKQERVHVAYRAALIFEEQLCDFYPNVAIVLVASGKISKL